MHGFAQFVTYKTKVLNDKYIFAKAGEVTITSGASPVNSLLCYIESFFLKHYAVHVFDDFADRAV